MELDNQCKHEEAYIEKACCSPFAIGDSGNVECACGGRDSVVCPDPLCDGIDEREVEILFMTKETR